jgi:copper chaperone
MEFRLEGMTCGHCVKAVTRAVQGVSPHARIEIDLPTQRVVVQGENDAAKLRAAIEAAGYKVA